MANEVFTADLEVRLRSGEASLLLRLYRKERSSGRPATIALLDRDIMRSYGQHLAVLEEVGNGEFKVLYCGAQVPLDKNASPANKTTDKMDPATAEFYRLGCREALSNADAICIDHRASLRAAIHRWEALFLPMEDREHHRMVVALCIPRETSADVLGQLLDTLPFGALVALPKRDSHNEVSDGSIIAATARLAQYAGVEKTEQLIGSSLHRLFGESSTLGNWDRAITALRTNKAQTFDFHCPGEGGVRWYHVQTAPFRDGMVISLADITDMKRAFLELDHQRKMLMDEMERRRGLEQELWALAHLDPLTALPNRRAFRESATVRLAESQTAHRPCAVVALDIDHFKRINDAFGHGAGDTVLRRVADIIKAPLRPNQDIAARMGGEEFAVILPDTDTDAAIAFAEKLRKRIEQTVVVVGEHEIRPTISLGVAMNRKSTNLDDLLDRADRALYTAKRTGRNKVCTEVDVSTSSPDAASAA